MKTNASHDVEKEITRGIAAAKSGDRVVARQILLSITKDHPHSIDAWMWLASISENAAELVEFLDRVLELDPENQKAKTWRAATIAMLEKEQARELLLAAKRMATVGRYADADAALNKYLSRSSDDLEAWAFKSIIAGTFEEKFDAFSEMLRLDPRNSFASLGRDLITEIAIAAVEEPLVADHDSRSVEADSEHNDLPQHSQVHEEESVDDFSIHETEAAPYAEALTPHQVEEEIMTSYMENCPFCSATLKPHAFSCDECNCALSLSDVEALLARRAAGNDLVQNAVSELESHIDQGEPSKADLIVMGMGHFNLGNFEFGLEYLNQAKSSDVNDVILAGQVNALAIRVEEVRRQDDDAESAPRGKTILVVDDSATVRKLISSKLEKAGHNVHCAVDGVDAMSQLESLSPDLVLLDITMPNMDGYQVCKLMRERESLAEIPVVMISGKDGFFDKVRGRMAGSTDYITKPFGPETLMKALDTYLTPTHAIAA